MSVTRRIDDRQWSAIEQISKVEGRPPANVLSLLIDRGLAARALGQWPTLVAPPRNRGGQ